MRRSVPMMVAGAATVLIAAFATLNTASAATVSATPAAWTPYLASADSTVWQLQQCGNTMYAVGSFTSIKSSAGTTFARNNVFSFNATTGAVSSWNPNANGTVWSIALSADCSTAYLGGSFTSVHGTAVNRLAKVSTSTGAVNTTFKPNPNGTVYKVLLQNSSRLIVGGQFKSIGGVSRAVMASLNTTSGLADSYVNLNITGVLPKSTQKIYNFSLSHSGTKLLAMGSFTAVSGQPRQQIFMVDLGTTSATLNGWNSPDFSLMCISRLAFYIQTATWSPDDSKIYTATTGRIGASPLCDTVAAWNNTPDGNQLPLWLNPTGCDSLFSVAADDTNVYVGGHQRWMNNWGVCEAENPGSIPRQGIASVDPATGVTTDWNPGRARGHGADDMELTSAGLWVASDNFDTSYTCAGQYHPGICFFPH